MKLGGREQQNEKASAANRSDGQAIAVARQNSRDHDGVKMKNLRARQKMNSI